MDDKFWAVLSNGKFVEANSWDDLQKMLVAYKENVKMYIARYYYLPYITQYGNSYYWPHFQILDKRGNARPYKRGRFKIININPDFGSYYFKHRRLTILDYKTREITEHLMYNECHDAKLFYNDLLVLLAELEQKEYKEKQLEI